jgi:peptidoglycan DL-endopeptidase CwlO
MKLRTKAVVGTFLVLTAAGSLPAGHAAAGHHASGGGPAVLDLVTSDGMPGNEQLANKMAAARGWGAAQQACLDKLWTEESAGTWSPTVVNPTSGAYGIPQAWPAGKMADPAQGGGPDWRTSAATQIRWGLDYIAGRYRTPCGAWQFETSHIPNWY